MIKWFNYLSLRYDRVGHFSIRAHVHKIFILVLAHISAIRHHYLWIQVTAFDCWKLYQATLPLNSTDKILQKYKRFRESCYLNLHLAQIEVHFSVTCVGWLSTIDMLFHAPKSVQHYIILFYPASIVDNSAVKHLPL